MLMVISRGFGSDVWILDEFMKFFDKELEAKESCFSFKTKDKGEVSTRDSFTSAGSLHVQSEFTKCVYCLGKHTPSRCDRVTDVNARKGILKKFQKCFLCLKGSHVVRNCKSSYVCRKCGGKHHISLCLKETSGDHVTAPESASGITCSNHVGVVNGILLQTAVSEVSHSFSSTSHSARILFDSGSQRSYISDNLRKKLGLKTVRTENLVLKTFGKAESVVKKLNVVRLFIKYKGNKNLCIEVLCVPFICDPLTSQNISKAIENYPVLKPLKLADRNSFSNIDVDVLIGVDYYHSFFSGKIIKTVVSGPTASETILGWVLSGPVSSDKPRTSYSNLCATSHVMRCAFEPADSSIEDPLRNELKRFWEIENVNSYSSQDCVVHQFEKDIRYNGERYVTKLPFRPGHSSLPSNLETAKARLSSLRRRLEKDSLMSEYNEVFRSYEKEGIIEKVEESELCRDSVHYLPHRGVRRDDKETTKLRVVFDASCSSNGPSLNDCLYSGPNLISKIFDILLRFRINPIATLSDIKQAFLNIEIDRDHQDFLRFLWYRDLDNCSEVEAYRFLRLVFGLTSSPFILNATIRHHLERFRPVDSSFIERFLQDLYVDDSTSGCSTVDEGKMFYNKSMSILSAGGFVLRKWVTNSKELQEFFNEKEGSESDIRSKKVLGVEWDLESDEFVFCFSKIIELARHLPATKRNVLKVAATFFDPLGFISPITARVKSIFQLLCKDKSDWDSEASSEILNVWNTFLADVERLGVLRVRRFALVEMNENIESVTLHGFCDSSLTCYAAVLYLQMRTSFGMRVCLLAAKTKVAPLRQISIARLELLGCVLLSELVKQVLSALDKRICLDSVKCWSDSQVALCWLKGKTKHWKPWVENRVVKIRKVVDCENWFFIRGKDNPADIPTRVCELSDFDRWFRGPGFLFDDGREFENFDVEAELNNANVLIESREKGTAVYAVATHEESSGNDGVEQCNIANIVDCTRFGNLNKLLNTTAYVVRFVNNLKNTSREEDRNECIMAEERENALMLWIRAEQNLFRKQRESNYQKLRGSLKLFDDVNGIIRLKGRFGSSSFDYDVKHPILMAGDRHFAELLVRDCHTRVMHAGVEATVSLLRRRFWIVKGRQYVKSILRKCVICKRYQGRTMNSPESPDLPNFRFNDSFSFCNIGLDYAGPLYVRDTVKADAKKVYILLFTCASSRAVHLELVPDMKSSAFIRAFERLVSRKGVPKFVISDNFKTFKSTQVKSFLAQQGIQQHFILPASPWWGGFYERLVRSVKLSLKKSLGRSLLTYEQLETVLCKSEFVINSRPLTYVSSDDLEEALTPFHLIFGRNVSYPSGSVILKEIANFSSDDVIKRAKYMALLVRKYWESFNSLYLNELREQHLYRKSIKNPSPPPVVGDVVMIRGDVPLPRQRWRLGKIAKLVIGNDGKVRGVELIVASETQRKQSCFRPLQKIIPLEVSPQEITPVAVIPDKNIEDTCLSNSRPKRHAAREGQLLRRLKEKYVD